jgi:hypothetical protein
VAIATTADADLELINGSTVIPLMLARPQKRDGTQADQPLTIQEALVASGAGLPLSEWLEPLVIEDWFSGIGLAYDAAPGCDTFSAPGYVLPGGAATDVTVTALNNSATPIIALAEGTSGDLWAAQKGSGVANTGRVLRSIDGGVTWTNSLNLGANEYLKDLLVARNSATGVTHLWASSGLVTGDSGRMHYWDGAAWTSTAAALFGTNGRNKMVKVFWEGEDGVGDWRIVALASNQGHLSYTRPGTNPMLAPSWVEFVPVGGGENLGGLVAAKRHVWAVSAENVYDFDELGNSPALTSYSLKHRGTDASAVLYHNGHVYRSAGVTLDRIRVDQGPILAEYPGTCSPGWATKAENPWLTGYVTALTEWLGGIVCATFSPALGRAAVFWGVEREIVGIESPNPMIWHGPFAISLDPSVVTAMYVTADSGTPSSSKLWLATWNTSQADQQKLSYVSLPPAGGSFSDLITGGGHRFANGAGTGVWQPTCQLYGLSTTLKDKGSRKDLYQLAIGTRGLPTSAPSGTDPYLSIYNRADATAAFTGWGTAVPVTTGPVLNITPDTTSGYRLDTRIDLFSPAGAATPPKPAMLDSVRWDYWRTAPDLDTWTFDVEFGPGVMSLHNSPWPNQGRDVTWFTDALVAMARAGRLVMRDRQDNRWSVKMKHYLVRETTLHDDVYGRTVQARITLALLGAA